MARWPAGSHAQPVLQRGPRELLGLPFCFHGARRLGEHPKAPVPAPLPKLPAPPTCPSQAGQLADLWPAPGTAHARPRPHLGPHRAAWGHPKGDPPAAASSPAPGRACREQGPEPRTPSAGGRFWGPRSLVGAGVVLPGLCIPAAAPAAASLLSGRFYSGDEVTAFLSGDVIARPSPAQTQRPSGCC